MVAKTIYDSTPEDTVVTSLKVIGVTRDGISVETDAAEGFSVDNLAPVVPSNFRGAVINDAVELTWDDPVDEDFQYFAVYRGTESGFDASAMDP